MWQAITERLQSSVRRDAAGGVGWGYGGGLARRRRHYRACCCTPPSSPCCGARWASGGRFCARLWRRPRRRRERPFCSSLWRSRCPLRRFPPRPRRSRAPSRAGHHLPARLGGSNRAAYCRRYCICCAFALDVADNLLARKHVTQIRVLVRVLDVVIALVTIGFALMTFDAVRQFGVTLFASAGVAGIIAGLAARPVLTNFIAGVQIAMAQPIRIDDAVIVENEWGNVEEITFSLCRAAAVGLAAHGGAAQLFYRKAVSELDQDRRRIDRHGISVRRPHGAGPDDPRKA